MAAPYDAPPADPPARHRRRGSVVAPLLLIFVGGVFLLQNVGVFPPSVWGNLWRLWPAVLVLIGVELLIGQRIPWLFALIGLAVVMVALGVAASSFGTPITGRETVATRLFQTDLGNARQASVTVRFGAGQLNVGPLAGTAASQLATMNFVGSPDLIPTPNYALVGDVGRLDYQVNGRGGASFFPFASDSSEPRMEVALSPNVPITTLVVQTGATDARLDLSSLKVSNLDLSIGAATAWIRMPESAGTTTAHINGGVATITLEIPQGVAAQIRHRGGLSSFNIDQTRFPPAEDEVNRSADYASATNKVDITIETGVTTIQVN
jgi:hypothetical protein